MSLPYQLLVFDWDGTLMDSESRIVTCMQAAARDAGVEVPTAAAARDIIGLGMAEAVEQLFGRPSADLAEAIIDHYRRHWLSDSLPPAPLFDGARDLLARLDAAGYLLAVATGKSRRGLDHVLAETRLAGHFVTTRCADEAFSKPHPQMLLDILERTGMTADQTLMIGDTEYDMAMAANAGAHSVGVSHGVHAPDRLLRSGARACFAHLNELSCWLDQAGVSPLEKESR